VGRIVSRGFIAGFRRPAADRTAPRAGHPAQGFAGGNLACCASCRGWPAWLRELRPDWIHAHYLTSHGTLAWLATSLLGAPGRLVGSAWGSDILVTPAPQPRCCAGCCGVCCAPARSTTSDSRHMAERMREHWVPAR
jgi:hypothetical protein